MNTVTKLANWSPATHSDPKPDPDPLSRPIDFILTPADKDRAILASLEAESARRKANRDETWERHGLIVDEVSPEAFEAARRVLVL